MSTNKPKITEIESYGVESIPHEDRRSTPMDLFRIAFGGANSFATVLLGAFPIFFGLSLVQALFATLLGVDRKSTRLNSSHMSESRMPSSA